MNQELRDQNTILFLPSATGKKENKPLLPMISMDHSETSDPPSSSSASIDGDLKTVCKKAMALLYSCGYDEADSLMRDANLALLRINSVVQLFKSESSEEDPIAKDFCLQEALSCAHRATQLSPSNLEFSFFYVKLLISYCQRYKEGIEECKRALAVTNPISDTADYLRASNFQEVSRATMEQGSLISYYREQLRSFLTTARYSMPDESSLEKRQDQELYDASCPVSREVLDTCERALALLHLNSFAKADRLLHQANNHRHNSFAFFHRVRALAHYYAQNQKNDLEAKRRGFQEAIASAHRATQLSPSNLEYSLFYVKLLICCREGIQEAVKECQRALAVTDPIDFFFERFLKEEAAKARMAFYQQSLRSILNKHTDAPSSSSVSKSTDHPPNEMENLSEQALQVSHQGEESSSPHSSSSSSLAFTSTNTLPSTDKVKNLTDPDGQIPHQDEDHCPYQSPSSSLVPTSTDPHPSPDKVKNLCRALQFIRKGDPVKAKNVLKGIRHKHKSSAVFHRVHSAVLCHYATKLINDPESQTYQYNEALNSAHRATILSPNNLEFSFYYVTRLVSHCKYEEAERECERALAITYPVDFLMDHIKESNQETSTLGRISLHQDHLQFLLHVLKSPNLSEKCRKTLLIDPDIVRIRTYLRSLQTPTEWRDLLRVPIKDFEDKTDFKFPFKALTFSHGKHIWKYWVCPCCDEQDFNDAQLMWQHMLEEHLCEPPEELQSFFPNKLDQYWTDKIVKGIWEPIDIRDRTTNSNPECSLSTDTERSFFLKRIKCNFWLLATNNCLSKSHIDKVLRYVTGENQVLPSVQELENVGTGDQLIHCIRILDSLQLGKVHNFLESLVQACNLCIRAERHSALGDAFLDSAGIGVTLDDSFLHIDLDLKPLSNSENSSSADDETWSSPDVNRVICWLYEDQNHTEKINALAAQREVETINIVEKLRNEYKDLDMICSKKSKLIQYQNALNLFKNKCENELAERANSADNLTQWKKELAERAESGNDSLICVISDILTEAEALNASRKHDGAINQSDDNDKYNSTSSLDDSSIKAAHEKLEESSNVKICIADAQIMKNLATTRQLQLNLERDCTVDYRVILVPHLRAYIQEALRLRIAEQKESRARIEASSKELLHDDEKQTDKRDCGRKQLQETTRGKKKNSNLKKSKRKQSRQS